MTDTVSRLDSRLSERYPEFSRAQLQKFIKAGEVKLNNKLATKASQAVLDGDVVELFHKKIPNSRNSSLTLPVLYEDDDCVVIDKPIGVLTHSKGADNSEATIASWSAQRGGFDFPSQSNRTGIVHRLDRATSGIMIVAKNRKALGALQKQFQTRKAKKVYRALVQGHVKQPQAILDLPIERNPKAPQKFRVGANGKPAITEYKVLKSLDDFDYLELRPTTGRTHQLRVHMKYLGHPIVGDSFYGGRPASRLYLHAYSLEITLPNRSRQTFTAAVPKDFLQGV